ncbi:uncharacterized protein [Dysidea avara]|uniref:uncharacterized protein isoform X2 n=1 Tax=Dysidea avara TaxID=196820 RepID=UPI003318C45B
MSRTNRDGSTLRNGKPRTYKSVYPSTQPSPATRNSPRETRNSGNQSTSSQPLSRATSGRKLPPNPIDLTGPTNEQQQQEENNNVLNTVAHISPALKSDIADNLFYYRNREPLSDLDSADIECASGCSDDFDEYFDDHPNKCKQAFQDNTDLAAFRKEWHNNITREGVAHDISDNATRKMHIKKCDDDYCKRGKSKKLVGDRETDNRLAKFFLNDNDDDNSEGSYQSDSGSDWSIEMSVKKFRADFDSSSEDSEESLQKEDDSLCGGCFVVVIVNHYCLLLSTLSPTIFK